MAGCGPVPYPRKEGAVARYYFDLYEGMKLMRDEEGSEFDSLDAAIQGAARSAAEIGTNRLVKGDFTDPVIEVRDERDQRTFTVTASMKIDWHVLPRHPS
jgi:hypothetical protein